MPSEISPFLHTHEVKRGYSIYTSSETLQQFRDKQQARFTLEKLRYRMYERHHTLASFMQRLGDFGRKYFGFLDPKQTGGGWW